MHSKKNNSAALIIFSKAPVAGRVKTRLVPTITSEDAASLYKTLLTKTLICATQTNFTTIELMIDGDLSHPFFKNITSQYPVRLSQQSGNDLGQRMFYAFGDALKKKPFAVLIGSDCPTLTCADIEQAGSLLQSGQDIVLGPAEDGGYYLIGLRKNKLQLFENITWGTDSIFAETMRRAQQLHLKCGLLPKRWDLDRPADLVRYNKLKY